LYGAEDIVAITGAEDIRAIVGAEDIGVEVVEVVVVVVTERSGADSKVVEWSGFWLYWAERIAGIVCDLILLSATWFSNSDCEIGMFGCDLNAGGSDLDCTFSAADDWVDIVGGR
jgi:hypothetical protein